MNEVDQDLLQEIMHQYAQREEVINTKYHIHQHYNCECTICSHQNLTDNQIKKDLKLDSFYELEPIEEQQQSEVDQQSFITQFKIINNLLEAKKKIVEQIDRPITIKDPIDLLSLALKMMQPTKNGKILNIRFMDTLFFYQREPCLMVYHDKDRGLKILKEKHLLINMLELRNFLINRRFQYDIDVRTATEKRLNPSFNNLEFDQKSAEIVQRIKKETQKISITTKDFILVKFRNGGQQVMAQLEMMQLFDKRRIDQIWDHIVMIQAYPYDFKGLLTLKPEKDTDSRYFRVHYDKDKIKYEDLFQKALEQICQINNPNISSGNFQREHERYMNQLKNDINQYLNYIVYQIVHFFEAYHKRKLTKIRIDFAKDDFGQYFIIDAGMMQFVDVNKIKWDEMILKEISLINQDYREQVFKEVEVEQVQQKERILQASRNLMRQKYLNQACNEITEHIRQNYLEKIEEAETQLKNEGDIEKTNKIFKALNPNVGFKFSYMLGLRKEEEEVLKKDLLNNFPIDRNRFLKKQKYQQDQREMQQKRDTYKKDLRISLRSPQKSRYSIQSTKSEKKYLVKTVFIPKQRSGILFQETRADKVNNYISKDQQNQEKSELNQYKYI